MSAHNVSNITHHGAVGAPVDFLGRLPHSRRASSRLSRPPRHHDRRAVVAGARDIPAQGHPDIVQRPSTIESARNCDMPSSAAPHAVLASVHVCSDEGSAGRWRGRSPVAGHRDTTRGPHEPTSRSRQTIAEVNASPHTIPSKHFTGIVQVPY